VGDDTEIRHSATNGHIFELAKDEGALKAQMIIVLAQAQELFDLHRDLLKNGLPMCKVHNEQITALQTLTMRIGVGLTICMCALFGADKVVRWLGTGWSPQTQGSYGNHARAVQGDNEMGGKP